MPRAARVKSAEQFGEVSSALIVNSIRSGCSAVEATLNGCSSNTNGVNDREQASSIHLGYQWLLDVAGPLPQARSRRAAGAAGRGRPGR